MAAMGTDAKQAGVAAALDLVSGSVAGKVVQLLFGDVLAFASIALKGGQAVRSYYEQRRKDRAASGNAQAAADLLLQAETRTRKEDALPQAQQQTLIILRAFGEAWGRCRAYGFSPAEIDLASIQRKFADVLAQHWVAALGADNPDPAAQFRHISRLVGDPLCTPYYRALWATLTDSDWRPPLLDMTRKLTFEQFFRLAYGNALAAPEGQELLHYLESIADNRTAIVRQLIIQDMAGWGARHVFGNVAHHEQLPDLPLCEMYVQPLAARRYVDWLTSDSDAGTVRKRFVRKDPPDAITVSDNEDAPEPDAVPWDEDIPELDDVTGEDDASAQPQDESIGNNRLPWEEEGAYTPPTRPWHGKPILDLIEVQLSKHHFVVVQADMGHGKSLSARFLAWKLAQQYLAAQEPTSQTWLPIFIKCAEDVTSSLVEDFPNVVRRALRRHARELQFNLAIDDPACAPPELTTRTLYILDGLDEVGLGERDRERLFEHLCDRVGDTRRFLVLSRPQVVPKTILKKRGVPLIEILPLTVSGRDSLAQEWIARWNLLVQRPADKPILKITDVASRGLTELAGTPILLFMIAYTWDEQVTQIISRAALYEAFFQHIAHGKHEQDQRAVHVPIRDSAEHLLGKLVDSGYLKRGELPRDAMLWLMSRVAWKAHCLEQGGYELCRSDVEDILKKELGMRGDREATRIICGGLLLALQADPDGDDPTLLFGHKSFREYMVARFWASALRSIVAQSSASEQVRLELLRRLLEGRLLQKEDRSFNFLMDIINQDASSEAAPGCRDWSGGERKRLCEWANAYFNDESIDGLDGKPILRTDRRSYLREAALAIGSAVRGGQIVAGDPLTLRSLLSWFWLRGETPILRAPGLQHAGANLTAVRLDDAVLDGANLEGASFVNAELSGVSLNDANLANSKLCDVRAAGLECEGANFANANMTDAELSHLKALGANFRGADLRGAKLDRANLRGAQLETANLCRVSLTGAALAKANLQGTLFTGYHENSLPPATEWPHDFDPIAAGAIESDDPDYIPF